MHNFFQHKSSPSPQGIVPCGNDLYLHSSLRQDRRVFWKVLDKRNTSQCVTTQNVKLLSASACHERGFIALMSAITLSAILLIVTVALNQSGFFARSILLDSEYKARSDFLAQACAYTAMLKFAADMTYVGNESIIITGDSCGIRQTKINNPANGYNTIETRAIFREATTNLRVIINSIDFSIISWDEVAHF